jgi:hypothetical protein
MPRVHGTHCVEDHLVRSALEWLLFLLLLLASCRGCAYDIAIAASFGVQLLQPIK